MLMLYYPMIISDTDPPILGHHLYASPSPFQDVHLF